ncbi:MAG: hypothetical protein IJ830_00610 [Alphaproteobacteria bacterium]|nr:hypothetical protein [Alphaproteobacteria bacterium]
MLFNGYEFNLSLEELTDIVENKTREIELIGPEDETYQALSEGDKQALEHLIKAASIINNVALEQDHPLNRSFKTAFEKKENKTPLEEKAYALFLSFNGVAGLNGIDPEPIEIFKDVHTSKGKNFYPANMSVDEFHNLLISMLEKGKIDEVKKILSNRTMVRLRGGYLQAIDYTDYFAYEFSKIANELELAAYYTTDHELKDYLSWQAQAFLQNNEDMDMLADKHWALMQNNPIEFTVSRENYEDELTGTVFENEKLKKLLELHQIEVNPKDTLGCRVGLNNKAGTELILKSKDTLPYLAKLMPFADRYEQKIEKNAKQTMVDVDLMALKGDYAMCRGGITTAQNLPNDDKLAVKTGGGRRNVYHRQVRFSHDSEREKKLLNLLVDPQLHPYFKSQMRHYFVIGHENGHSLGPDSSFKNALGIYAHTIEEHKANTVSIAFLGKIAETFGTYTPTELKEIYTTWVISLFLRSKPVLSKPHRVADLIEFNYLLKHNVISFDGENKLHIDFEKIPTVMYRLLEETIEIQLSKSASKAKEFIDKWSDWSEISEYIANTQKQLGLKPYIRLITKF